MLCFVTKLFLTNQKLNKSQNTRIINEITFKGIVDEENCWSNAEGTRPSEKTRHCNEDPCPANWWVGPWQLCPVTCKRHGMCIFTDKKSFESYTFSF